MARDLRFMLVFLTVLLSTTTLPASQAASGSLPLTYTLRTSIGLGFDGGRVVAVDHEANRAWIASTRGLRVLDIPGGTLSEPVSRLSFSGSFEAAPEIGRLFAVLTSNDLVSLDVETLAVQWTVPIGDMTGFTYDAEHRELYVHGLRSRSVRVLDALTGELQTTLELPGRANGALVVPGRVFIRVRPSDDLMVIETSTKAISTWPLRKDFSRFSMMADPSGRTLFITTDKHIRAWDSVTGELRGEVVTGGPSWSSYDPVAGVLLTILIPPNRPLYRLVTSRLDAGGLRAIAAQDLPAHGQGVPVPTPGGFLTTGLTGSVGTNAVPDLRRKHLLIWDRQVGGER